MVKQVQTINEYYVYEEDDPLSMFYAPTYYETDEQLVLISCLMILEQRFRLLSNMSIPSILEEIDEIISSLESELSKVAIAKIRDCVRNSLVMELEDYGIPDEDYVEADTSLEGIIIQSITTLCEQLCGEIKTKSLFFKDNLSKDTFSIVPNFKRAVKKLIDAVGVNLIFTKEKSHRNVLKFVYGEDKLYRWLSMNDSKVCAWCRMQESSPPRKLEDTPLDHPYGRCTLEPIDFTFSDQYKLLVANSHYSHNSSDEDKRWV